MARIPNTDAADDAGDGAWSREWLYEAALEAGETPGLVWYRFEADGADGQRAVYGNAEDNLGGEGRQGREESYQVTVYDPSFDPPRWLREGVMY